MLAISPLARLLGCFQLGDSVLVSVVSFCTLQELRVTGLFILSHPGKLSRLIHCCLSSDGEMTNGEKPQAAVSWDLTSADLGAMGICHTYSPSLSFLFWCFHTQTFPFAPCLWQSFPIQFLALAAEEFSWLCALPV